MGRVTYEALARETSSGTDDVSKKMNALPKMVVSRSLQEPLHWENTTLLRADLAEGIATLKRQPGVPLRTIGSISLVRSLIRLDLVDRLRLVVFPLVLGDAGREPIYSGFARTQFELIDTAVLDRRLLVLEYRPVVGSH